MDAGVGGLRKALVTECVEEGQECAPGWLEEGATDGNAQNPRIRYFYFIA